MTTDGVIDGTVSGWEVPVCPLCTGQMSRWSSSAKLAPLSPPCLPATGDPAHAYCLLCVVAKAAEL